MPPVSPLVKPNPFLRPRMVWAGVNADLNMMSRKTLNTWREKHNMPPVRDQWQHAPLHADNYLMYSPSLGEVDRNWKYCWHIGGYCFNDIMPYDEIALKDFLYFINKDKRPALFFTLGSINGILHDRLAECIFDICRKCCYKLVVGCGWWKVGKNLVSSDNLFLLDKVIPHRLILPHCDAVIHHGEAAQHTAPAAPGNRKS